MTTTVALTARIYTHDSLHKTIAAFEEFCTASFSTEHDTHVLEIAVEQAQIKDEFLNYALALSAQELLG